MPSPSSLLLPSRPPSLHFRHGTVEGFRFSKAPIRRDRGKRGGRRDRGTRGEGEGSGSREEGVGMEEGGGKGCRENENEEVRRRR